METTLSQAYVTLRSLIGSQMEDIAVFERAEEHRAYWRPKKVRVVLLAESHVYTNASDLTATLDRSSLLPPDIPTGFVRLVYCMGYGENALLREPIETPRNSGTPQFWEIFHSCIHSVTTRMDFSPVHVSKTELSNRIRHKVSVLEQLRSNGIWLVDASIAALYQPGTPKQSPQWINQALAASWNAYTRQVVADANPEAILCVGLGVARALRPELTRLGIAWSAVRQPNARASTEEHLRSFAAYYAVCRDPKSICDVRFVG